MRSYINSIPEHRREAALEILEKNPLAPSICIPRIFSSPYFGMAVTLTPLLALMKGTSVNNYLPWHQQARLLFGGVAFSTVTLLSYQATKCAVESYEGYSGSWRAKLAGWTALSTVFKVGANRALPGGQSTMVAVGLFSFGCGMSLFTDVIGPNLRITTRALMEARADKIEELKKDWEANHPGEDRPVKDLAGNVIWMVKADKPQN